MIVEAIVPVKRCPPCAIATDNGSALYHTACRRGDCECLHEEFNAVLFMGERS